MLQEAQNSAADQRLSDGRLLRLVSRPVTRRVSGEELLTAVSASVPPAVHFRAAHTDNEDEDDDVSVHEVDAPSDRTDLDRFTDWVETLVLDMTAPRSQSFKLVKLKRPVANAVDGAEAETHVRRFEAYKQSIDNITSVNAEQVKELRSAVTQLEEPVMNALDRMGGSCRYRVVHEGQEIYAGLYIAQRKLKGRMATPKEMKNMVRAAVRARMPEDASFEELRRLWTEDSACTDVGRALAEGVAEIERATQKVKRAVVLRRNGVD